MSYKNVLKQQTPQTRPADTRQARNNAGGYSFVLDDMKRLERFLILGSEGGTFYVNERKLTLDNLGIVTSLAASKPEDTLKLITEISVSGRAIRNDSAILALAAFIHNTGTEWRSKAYTQAFPAICRTGNDLFKFAEFQKLLAEGNDKWSRMRRNGYANWYNDKPVDRLAYLAIKYQQRQGWSHKDLLRLAHVHPGPDVKRSALYKYITGDVVPEGIKLVTAWEKMKAAKDEDTAIGLIEDYGLTWEFVTTEWLKYPRVWRALLPNLPLDAMISNLGRMTANGAIPSVGESRQSKQIAEKLGDLVALRRSRLHPLSLLVALRVYGSGRGVKGSLNWNPNREVLETLEKAFYDSFQVSEPSNKRFLLALDVSGSMSSYFQADVPLMCCEATAAMAMVMARVETVSQTVLFNQGIEPSGINRDTTLEEALYKVKDRNGGGTDCSMPMIWATQNRTPIDCFVVMTDNETWAGRMHPHQALQTYRDTMGIPAKMVVVGMQSTGFTIADPSDAGMLDVVGFDPAIPNLITSFAR